jgi:mRNA-degrading endonuclease RelE of RelBE toxin-antitoxin system
MFKDEYHPGVKKDLKKLDLAIRTKIKNQYIPKILSNPKIGETLVGDLKGVFSYHFRAFKQQSRLLKACLGNKPDTLSTKIKKGSKTIMSLIPPLSI